MLHSMATTRGTAVVAGNFKICDTWIESSSNVARWSPTAALLFLLEAFEPDLLRNKYDISINRHPKMCRSNINPSSNRSVSSTYIHRGMGHCPQAWREGGDALDKQTTPRANSVERRHNALNSCSKLASPAGVSKAAHPGNKPRVSTSFGETFTLLRHIWKENKKTCSPCTPCLCRHRFKLGEIVLHEILELLLCRDPQLPGEGVMNFVPVSVVWTIGLHQELLQRFLVEQRAGGMVEGKRRACKVRKGCKQEKR